MIRNISKKFQIPDSLLGDLEQFAENIARLKCALLGDNCSTHDTAGFFLNLIFFKHYPRKVVAFPLEIFPYFL